MGGQSASHSQSRVVLDGQGKLRQDGITDCAEMRIHQGGNTAPLAKDFFPSKVNFERALVGVRPNIRVAGSAQNMQH